MVPHKEVTKSTREKVEEQEICDKVREKQADFQL